MDYGLLNLGSIVLGLTAIALPLVYLAGRGDAIRRRWPVWTVGSLMCCMVALCLQPFYTNHLIEIEDWGALLDTTWGVAYYSAGLVGVVIFLNLVSAGMRFLENKAREQE